MNKQEIQEIDEKQIKAKVEKICKHPYVKKLIHNLANTIIQKILRLPMKAWMQEAIAHNFDGIILCKFEHVNAKDLLIAWSNYPNIRNLVPKPYCVVVDISGLVFLFKDKKSSEKVNENVIPIIRATCSPF